VISPVKRLQTPALWLGDRWKENRPFPEIPGKAGDNELTLQQAVGRHAMVGRASRVGGQKTHRTRTIVTLEDVAREAGVHYSTVSRALDPAKVWRVNVSTRQHVQAVAKRMGYQPDMVASGLKRGRTNTVAVVVADLGNPNIAPVLRGIANGLEPAGMMSLVCETLDDSARLERTLNHLLSRRVDAIIMTAARKRDAPRLRELRRRIPLLLAVQNVPGIRLPASTSDDFLGGVLAAQHLLSLGHRRLAQLRGPTDINSCLERAKGFSATVAAAGAVEVVVRSTAPVGSPEEGARLMRKLLDSKGTRPTGIFTHHDLMAFGALTVAEERGLMCPRDLSIVGYHDLPHVDRIVPPLTSIQQERERLGRIAAELLVQLLASPNRPPAARKLAPTLVVRRSTGPAPDGSSRP
jgi:LacI family transcriptional regulator